MTSSAAEETLALVLRSSSRAHGLPEAVREYRFHPTRRWRFDFCWPAHKLAVEIDGRGRHQTVDGVRKDCEKHNAAVALGWRILRFPSTDKGDVMAWVDTIAACLLQPQP